MTNPFAFSAESPDKKLPEVESPDAKSLNVEPSPLKVQQLKNLSLIMLPYLGEVSLHVQLGLFCGNSSGKTSTCRTSTSKTFTM